MANIGEDGVTVIGESVRISGNLSGEEDLHVLGRVEGSIDLRGLLPVMQRPPGMNMRDDVLNGIARDPADGGIWVTGKNWPFLYRIELVPAPVATTPAAKTR